MPNTYADYWDWWNHLPERTSVEAKTEKDKPMPNSREYVLRGDGSITRRTITEDDLDLSQQLLDKLTANAVLRVPDVDVWKGVGKVGYAKGQGMEVWTITLERLIIRTQWRIIEGKILVPNFSSKSDPTITVTWVPFPDLKLKLCILQKPTGKKAEPYQFGGAWLFACDKAAITYRLPLGNVHDDCSCCTGADTAWPSTSQLGLVRSVLENFDQANYNADLWRSAEATQSLFRVKQNSDGGFVTLDPKDQHWTVFCAKVASSISSLIV